MNNPAVTVLMPVYNCSQFICEAVESILAQTFTDFELLIIDDASTDDTVLKLKAYNDARIQLIVKPQNTGYTNSLNYGLGIAKGKYIARMDGDDISMPERFAKQYQFLEENDDVVLCGTQYKFIETETIVKVPISHSTIVNELLKGNCIAHPSVMMRSEALSSYELKYDVNKEPAEDYDMWVRMINLGHLYNIPEVLLLYRLHDGQVSSSRRAKQRESAISTQIKLMTFAGYRVDDKEELVLMRCLDDYKEISFDDLKVFYKIVDELSSTNKFFDSLEFKAFITIQKQRILNKYFLKRKNFFPILVLQYLSVRIRSNAEIKLPKEFKFAIKSLFYYKI